MNENDLEVCNPRRNRICVGGAQINLMVKIRLSLDVFKFCNKTGCVQRIDVLPSKAEREKVWQNWNSLDLFTFRTIEPI